MILLSKILPPLFFPLGLVIGLCLLAAWLAFRRGARAAGVVALSAGIVIYAGSSQVVVDPLARGLERRYLPPVDYPRASAIVLLGGAMEAMLPPRVEVETRSPADRPLHAARLWKRGLAPVIVATGGYIPFLTDAPGSEADLYARLLAEIAGIPDSAVLRVGRSRNTHEDALYSAALFDSLGLGKDILLVTSATHMPRAAALFRKAGFVVHPAPTDFQAEDGAFRAIALLPSGSVMMRAYVVLNEYAGLLAYRLMGRL